MCMASRAWRSSAGGYPAQIAGAWLAARSEEARNKEDALRSLLQSGIADACGGLEDANIPYREMWAWVQANFA